jgi:multisubunit Na+/H+ antiporter MnhB subunit
MVAISLGVIFLSLIYFFPHQDDPPLESVATQQPAQQPSHHDQQHDRQDHRLMVAISLGVIFLSLIYFFLPNLSYWRSSLFFSMTG